MTTPSPEQFTRDMGMTLREFMRTLPAAVFPLPWKRDAGLVIIRHPAGRIRLSLQESPNRRIGALELPVLRVDFLFSGLDTAERGEFMRHFDLSFHRGGG